jgi:hypothetical protein
LNPASDRTRCSSERVSGPGDTSRCDRLVSLALFRALAPTQLDQAVELAQAHLFVLEQPPQRIELDRVVLTQDFGGGGEFTRVSLPRVVSERGFDRFDSTMCPYKRTGLKRLAYFRAAYAVGKILHRSVPSAPERIAEISCENARAR